MVFLLSFMLNIWMIPDQNTAMKKGGFSQNAALTAKVRNIRTL
jgi:hypothetical protein